MARMTFKAGEEYAIKLSKLATGQEEIAKKAIYAAAGIVADKIKSNLNSLPEEKFRYLRAGEKFVGVPERQKKDLIDSFGITPITTDNKGNWNAKIGFDGYGRFRQKIPEDLPNQLLAGRLKAVVCWRKKPFVRPAERNKKRKEKWKKLLTKKLKNMGVSMAKIGLKYPLYKTRTHRASTRRYRRISP